jgi:hypothetical protein
VSQQRAYVLAFFLSLSGLASTSYEVDILNLLLNRLADTRQAIESFWTMREVVLLVCRTQASYHKTLTDIYLNRPEIRVIAEKIDGQSGVEQVEAWISARELEIKQLRSLNRQGSEARDKVQLDKLEKHFKIGKTSAAAVVHFFFFSFMARSEEVCI